MIVPEHARVRVYGAGWCADTARTRRLLKRLNVAHAYRDVDLDLDALREALALHGGPRRTPIVEVDGAVLAEPPNGLLLESLVRAGLLDRSTLMAHRKDLNVGDLDRALRAVVALAAVAASTRAPRALRWPMRFSAAVLAFTALRGWCPIYDAWEVTSLDGLGDRPDGAERRDWLASTAQSLAWSDQ